MLNPDETREYMISFGIDRFAENYTDKVDQLLLNISNQKSQVTRNFTFIKSSIIETLIYLLFSSKSYLEAGVFEKNETYILHLIETTHDYVRFLNDFSTEFEVFILEFKRLIQDFKPQNSEHNHQAIFDLEIMHYILNHAHGKLPANPATKWALTKVIKSLNVSSWESSYWKTLNTNLTSFIELTEAQIRKLKEQPDVVSDVQSVDTINPIVPSSQNLEEIKAKLTGLLDKLNAKLEIAQMSDAIYANLETTKSKICAQPRFEQATAQLLENNSEILDTLKQNHITISTSKTFLKKYKPLKDIVAELNSKLSRRELVLNEIERLEIFTRQLNEILLLLNQLETPATNPQGNLKQLSELLFDYQSRFDALSKTVEFLSSDFHSSLLAYFLTKINENSNENTNVEEQDLTIEKLQVIAFRQQIKHIEVEVDHDIQFSPEFFEQQAQLITTIDELMNKLDNLADTFPERNNLRDELSTHVNSLWDKYDLFTQHFPSDVTITNKIAILKQILEALIAFFHPIKALIHHAQQIALRETQQNELPSKLAAFVANKQSQFSHRVLMKLSKEYKTKFDSISSIRQETDLTHISTILEIPGLQNKFSLWSIKNSYEERQSQNSVAISA